MTNQTLGDTHAGVELAKNILEVIQKQKDLFLKGALDDINEGSNSILLGMFHAGEDHKVDVDLVVVMGGMEMCRAMIKKRNPICAVVRVFCGEPGTDLTDTVIIMTIVGDEVVSDAMLTVVRNKKGKATNLIPFIPTEGFKGIRLADAANRDT